MSEPSEPDDMLLKELLDKDFEDWDKPGRPNDVWIRILHWFSTPDTNGVADYWGEWVFYWNMQEPFRELINGWAILYRPGTDVDDYNFYCPLEDDYVDEDRAPDDYGIDEYETIVIEELEDFDDSDRV